MNTPIDPREGYERQKALRQRLAQMAVQGRKATVGRLGQTRGRVRSMGAIGGARGARFPGNGMARPGALNFLQAADFGLRAIDGPGGFGLRQGPEMSPFGGPIQRHVSNPLPSSALEGPNAQGGPTGPLPVQAPPVQAPSIPDAQLEASLVPAPGPPQVDSPDRGEIITTTSGRGAGYTSTANAMTPKLIPLGGGQYLDPSTGYIHGAGGVILNAPGGRDAAGGANFKAL